MIDCYIPTKQEIKQFSFRCEVRLKASVKPEPNTSTHTIIGNASKMAGEVGFEPTLTDPESAVLPLDYSPVR